ncbi:MAG: helix-turn-helix transcriptional regulator [Oscillospiraceae bacterium]|nr:helix-turn-helix transcriptional regulator [Oscillospiraceae bacterium]
MIDSKYIFNPEKAQAVLPQKLSTLLCTSEDVKALAKHLNCSVQAINQYKNGTSFPKTENLVKIAQFFNCSLDWLIDLSPTKNPDAEIKAICDYTGLSEIAIENLHCEAKDKQCIEALNFLLGSSYDDLHRMDWFLYMAIKCAKNRDKGRFRKPDFGVPAEVIEQVKTANCVVLDQEGAMEHYLSKIGLLLRDTLEEL